MADEATAASATSANGAGTPATKTKTKPTKALPSDRMAVPKQLQVLLAYAAAAANKPGTPAEVGKIVELHPDTVATASAFFLETGLLTRADGGGFAPSPEVLSFQRAHEWDPETAAYKLAPRISQSWIGVALLARLRVRAMDEDEAIAVLAEAAAAGPDYKNRLKVCIEYLTTTGLVQRDGTQLRATKGAAMAQPMTEAPTVERRETPTVRDTVTTTFEQNPVDGMVRFAVSVQVDMKEFRDWQPDRLAAFFNGIAAVLAAKGAIEKTN